MFAKYNRKIFALSIVFVLDVITVEAKRTGNDSNFGRIKRQQDDKDSPEAPWTWGYVDDPKNNPLELIRLTETTTAAPEENPCERQLPSLPDFTAPGRRISSIKCYEYIWEIKYREVEAKKHADCVKYRKKPQHNHAIGGRATLPGEFPHMALPGNFKKYKHRIYDFYATNKSERHVNELEEVKRKCLKGAIGWKAAQGTWIFKCGGSVISDKFIMTAAHCSKVSALDTTVADVIPKIVRLGDKNIIDKVVIRRPLQEAQIINIIVHPQYQSPKKYFDIALMELKEKQIFNFNLQPACLWTEFDTSSLGLSATLTGWGVVETVGKTTSPNLQAAVVDIVDSQTCDAQLRPMCNRVWCGIQDHQICAGKPEGGVDACQGDSGGPLQVKINLPPTKEGAMHYVIGVTSFGFGCALANTPGVYTRVSTFIDWIEGIVWTK